MEKNIKERSIVYIEDDIIDQEIFIRAIKDLNEVYSIVCLNNGFEALEYLKNNGKPFLIFCDTNMPKMNGLELLEILYKENIYAEKIVPFILLTGSASPYEVKTAYTLSSQGIFEKKMDYLLYKEQIKFILGYWKNAILPESLF